MEQFAKRQRVVCTIFGFLFCLLGLALWLGPLGIALFTDSNKPEKTAEIIQRQIAFCESELEKLQGEEELDLFLTESDKARTRSRGVSEEKIAELEGKTKKSEELYKRGRELLIKKWEDKIKKLCQELEELSSKGQRYNSKSHEKG